MTVRAVLTKAGAEFVTPLSLAALTGHPVHQALFSPEDETAMGHIELSRWADLVVVAPGHRRADGQGGERPGRRPGLHRPAGHRQAGAAGPGHECAHVAAPGGEGQSGAPDRLRRLPRHGGGRPRRGRDGLRRVRAGPHGRAGRDPGGGAGAAGRRRRTPPEGQAGAGDGGPDLRAHRPGARADQSLQRQAGLRHRRGPGRAGRRGDAGVGPDGPAARRRA